MATLYEWTGAGFEAQAHLQEVLDDPDSTEEERAEALKEFQAIQMAIEKKLESYLIRMAPEKCSFPTTLTATIFF